jgi:hypothetical protein
VSEPEVPTPTPVDRAAFEKAQRGRNVALALGLVVFVVIVFVVTVIKMGGNVASRPF